MFAIIGATGQVGGAAADALLAAGETVRVVVRDPAKATSWQQRGATLAVAELTDAGALQRAFSGTRGAFIMTPPYVTSEDMFGENLAGAKALAAALRAAAVPKVVFLSSVGSEHPFGTGGILKTHDLEREMFALPAAAIAAIRAAWFMENFAGVIPLARQQGAAP